MVLYHRLLWLRVYEHVKRRDGYSRLWSGHLTSHIDISNHCKALETLWTSSEAEYHLYCLLATSLEQGIESAAYCKDPQITHVLKIDERGITAYTSIYTSKSVDVTCVGHYREGPTTLAMTRQVHLKSYRKRKSGHTIVPKNTTTHGDDQSEWFQITQAYSGHLVERPTFDCLSGPTRAHIQGQTMPGLVSFLKQSEYGYSD